MPADASGTKPRALFLAPEPFSSRTGGGALRSASLFEYLRTRYDVTPVIFGEHIAIPRHSRHPIARVWRNTRRYIRGVPPLVDRFAGFEQQVMACLGDSRFDLGLIEHFWCAPYARILKSRCARLVLDLHNIESELGGARARLAGWPASQLHDRFATAYRALENEYLPEFDAVLVASEVDRARVNAPNVIVYPNSLPPCDPPAVPEQDAIAFSGNMDYDPNIDAVRWFRREIWPLIVRRYPKLEWRLVGMHPESVAHLVTDDPRIRLVGPVDDAIAELGIAKLCVVPLRAGSGTRFKILEAWAARRAVISTTIGAEGLGARDGEHLLLADSAASFANAVIRLLETPELRAHLGERGRSLFEQRYTWPAAWNALDNLMSGPGTRPA
jgi:glycosyltransferase involved in cell wall biosynthesis